MNFSKMHGLSNDFMIIETITQKISLTSKKIQTLSDRYKGVGFDQLLLVEKSFNSGIEFNYRIFNSDGSEVEQCGNGARCFALFVYLKGLTKNKKIFVSTKKGILILKILKNNLVRVNMGKPNFLPKEIPLLTKIFKTKYSLFIKEKKIYFGAVSIGNPHCVITVNDINTKIVSELSPLIQKNDFFPNSVNVGFMEIINSEKIKLRVYERGSNETKSCGSGACAAVAVGIKQNILSNKVSVELKGGKLEILWKKENDVIYMTGLAEHVYDGSIYL
ncbi:diaminopimelate epimerase [Buchnera aphidicola (Mindarus keteleerifoliae)]|uniref:diaminopimelate epimerase n=1 Tax=Buchnera aphidicola TaxID=9 RepID=UPI0031B6CF56